MRYTVLYLEKRERMRRQEQRVGKKREGERKGGKEREGETEVLREGRRERRRKGRREGGTKERKRGNRREEGGEKKKCPAPPRMLSIKSCSQNPFSVVYPLE